MFYLLYRTSHNAISDSPDDFFRFEPQQYDTDSAADNISEQDSGCFLANAELIEFSMGFSRNCVGLTEKNERNTRAKLLADSYPRRSAISLQLKALS